MKDLGVTETKESTKRTFAGNLRQNLGVYYSLKTSLVTRVFVIPENLSRFQLAEVAQLQQQQCECQASMTDDIRRVALEHRKAICCNENEMSWPPEPSQLTEDGINLPNEVRVFLATLLTGSPKYPEEEPCSSKVQRLVNSFGHNMVFGVTGGRKKPPKHILLPYAVKTLTNNVELIQILNRCGHGVAYSQIEELNTALCLQKMAMNPENAVPLPDNIKPYRSTSLAWDNIDRLEETLLGRGTSHRVNGIAIQGRQFGPNLPPTQATPQ